MGAAGLNPLDTAHNTAFSILADGGLLALFVAAAILALTARGGGQMRGRLRLALATALAGWFRVAGGDRGRESLNMAADWSDCCSWKNGGG